MARVSGCIVTVPRKDGDVFYIKARDRNGRQIKKRVGPVYTGRSRPAPGTWSRKQADDALRDYLTDLGRAPEGPKDAATFADAARAWLYYVEHDRKRRPSTLRDYRNSVNRYLLPAFGDRDLHGITSDDIDTWREQQVADAHLSDRTINKLLALMHGIFARAARVYGLPGNPVAAADRQPHRRHGDIEVLDPGDVRLLASHAASEQDAAIYTVAAFTGLRLGELLALRFRDVDFAKRIVHVRWSYVQGREDRPKSHRVRSVPLSDEPARVLDGLSRREFFTGPDDLVFVNQVGKNVDGSRLRKRYVDALAAAGLRPLRFHDLRHTFGTLAVQAFPLTDVKAYMGHADIQTTMIYVHHVPQHDAANRLSQLTRMELGRPTADRSIAVSDRTR